MAARSSCLCLFVAVVCMWQSNLVGGQRELCQRQDATSSVKRSSPTVAPNRRPEWLIDGAVASIIEEISRLKSGQESRVSINNSHDERGEWKLSEKGTPSICSESLGAASSGYSMFCRRRALAPNQQVSKADDKYAPSDGATDVQSNSVSSKSSYRKDDNELDGLRRLLLAPEAR